MENEAQEGSLEHAAKQSKAKRGDDNGPIPCATLCVPVPKNVLNNYESPTQTFLLKRFDKNFCVRIGRGETFVAAAEVVLQNFCRFTGLN